MKIVVGQSADGKSVAFDLDTLIVSRLLITANSGAGKSWLLRRLAEQLFPHIQVIIIDPEGEFATLREKFGFVLVGKGGEAAADVRLAGDVALKLLELRASAVCDLYELKKDDRQQWVKNFLDSLMEAPKNLWHPAIVIVDEAHVFCPENGEAIAAESVIDLSTRGRKRGFCPVLATQRLAKIAKDATADLNNRLVGGTFEDVDVKRALELLSVAPEDKRTFSLALRTLEPGNFYALGRAVAKERALFKAGAVETTHPKPGSAKHAAAPPPPPDQVRELLPKLADLPKEAAERASTIEDYKRQIRELRSDLAAARRAQPAVVPAIDGEKLKARIENAVRAALKERDTWWMRAVREYCREAEKRVGEVQKLIVGALNPPFNPPPPVGEVSADFHVMSRPVPVATPPSAPVRGTNVRAVEGNGNLPGGQQRILKALAMFEAIGRNSVSKKWIAAVAGVSAKSSGYQNNLGALRTAGYIDYRAAGEASLTDEGRKHAPAITAPAGPAEMLEYCLAIVTPAQGRILEVLFGAYPKSLPKADLARLVGVSANSSGYQNNLGSLRSAGMIDYPVQGEAKAAAWLFLEAE